MGMVTTSYAQYGNEWINYTQTYYKIPVVEEGLYRITPAQLQAGGFPTSIDPRTIQVFHRGQEQAIRVQGEADGVLNPTDYVEFYGQGNDGLPDRALYYTNPAFHLNPYVNLHSDTTAYFITYKVDGSNGKRMPLVDVPNTGFTPEVYHNQEELRAFKEEMSAGRNYVATSSSFLYISSYDLGKGYASLPINPNTVRDFTFPIANHTGTVPPRLEVDYVSRSNANANITIAVGNSTGSLRNIGSFISSGYSASTFTQTLQLSDFPSVNGDFIVRVSNGTGTSSISIVAIRLTYAQQLNANSQPEKYFTLNPQAGGTSLVQISNAPSNASLLDITDLNNVRAIRTTASGTLNAVINNTNTSRRLYLTGSPKSILGLQAVTFNNFDPALYNYIIVSHPKLMQPALGYSNAVQAYADYRASIAGGSHSTFIVDINQLYDQFNYGEYSPLAIRNFAKYMYDNGTPEYIFLIGRAITLRARDPQFPSYSISLDIRNNPANRARNLVPTFGYPGSDIPLTANFNGRLHVPAIPISRITVDTPEEVARYLNKMKEHETIGGDVWRKNIIHLSGGIEANERTNFRNFLGNYEALAEGKDFFAGSVFTVAKRTTETVEFINISNQINDGASLVTFFGHSGIDITDIDIGRCSDDANGYRNKGKYPMVLANGCSIGDVWSGRFSLAEDWMFTPDRGAIAWLATAQLGGAPWLNNYSARFYTVSYTNPASVGLAIEETFGRPIGKIHQNVVQSYSPGELSRGIELAHVQQMTLQGDPAMRLVIGSETDYHTQDTWLSLESFDGTPINARADSVKLNIIVANLARTSRRPLDISVTRTLSSGVVIDHTPAEGFDPIDRVDTLSITLNRPEGVSTFGNNRIEVRLDYRDSIPEVNEMNNRAVIEFFFPDIGARALFPPPYSIVSNQPVTLVAQSGNTDNQNRDIIFEIDTSHTFNSPVKKSAIVPTNGVASWQTTLLTDQLPSDSLVYYWRVNFADAINNSNVLWDEQSFTYIKDSPAGWSQRPFPQFSESADVQIVKDNARRRWLFQQITNRVQVTTFGGANPNVNNLSLSFDNIPIIATDNPLTCITNGLVLMAVDGQTQTPYQASNFSTCGRRQAPINGLSTTALNDGTFAGWIASVKTGDYVILFNKGNINASTWNTIKPQLRLIGATEAALATLQNGHGYILVGRKGGQALHEVIATSISTPTQDQLDLDAQVGGGATEGSITSTRIGPASDWSALYKTITSAESPSTDENRLEVIGVQLDGQEQVLINNVVPDVRFLNTINADTYPYLKLRLHTRDVANATPAQIRKWLVLFEGVPEGFINIDKIGAEKYEVSEKQEGETFSLTFAFENIGDKDYASEELTVEYVIINQTNSTQERETLQIKAPKIGETTEFTIDIETLGRGGTNALRVFVNPRIEVEQYFDNNIFEVSYEVIADNKNPLLDVTFDGVRILDGEIVSPSPLIGIRLRDDNPFITREDTVGLEIALKRPCDGCSFENIYFSDPNLRWVQEEGNFNVEYHPKNLGDGIYSLRVQGTDARGNAAGTVPYEINFEVINESTVTNFFPYPNPFSGSTRFVFTLTGAEIPQQIKIQIMTVTGKVVREITQDELGPIRIGNNISQYAWDGTDEFGDKLANGVYLYRVSMRLNGEGMKQRATAADKAFKKGFGKLYILR